MRNTDMPRATTLIAVLSLVLAASLPAIAGCAAVEKFGPMLLKYGIGAAEELAAGGEKAIADAREKALAIPDALDRQTALLEIIRAEQIRQTYMLEYLVACHPPEFAKPAEPAAEPDTSAKPVSCPSAPVASPHGDAGWTPAFTVR